MSTDTLNGYTRQFQRPFCHMVVACTRKPRHFCQSRILQWRLPVCRLGGLPHCRGGAPQCRKLTGFYEVESQKEEKSKVSTVAVRDLQLSAVPCISAWFSLNYGCSHLCCSCARPISVMQIRGFASVSTFARECALRLTLLVVAVLSCVVLSLP